RSSGEEDISMRLRVSRNFLRFLRKFRILFNFLPCQTGMSGLGRPKIGIGCCSYNSSESSVSSYGMKIALVHELLTMRGGAERVLKILADMFPDAPIYTLLYNEKKLGDWFPKARVRPTRLQSSLTTHYSLLTMAHEPLSFQELKAMRKPLRNINIEHKQKLSQLDTVALYVTRRVGTMGFFLIILAWTFFWLTWNVFAPTELRFDPYPAFAMWLFISNMIQILLMPLIMAGQNLLARHSEARTEADYEINMKAEREIETIVQHLENQNDLILKILNRVEGGK
ncbi:MAG: DUF1003 domain-containing protein, partial [bacterium]|nr:DUF1003 domain-containing protein [bacterium]